MTTEFELMTVPDQPSAPRTGMANGVIDGSSEPLATLDSGCGLAGEGSPSEWGSVTGVSGILFPGLLADDDPLGGSVLDGTGGGIDGAGEATGSSDGPGPSVGAGNNARGGSLMKLSTTSVSQLAQAGSIDCSPVVG